MRFRSLLVPVVLGVILLVMAFVTRSGYFGRDNPGLPINSAMREALDRQSPQLSTDDEMEVAKVFGTAHKLPSGLRYIVRAPGTGEATPTIGDEVIAMVAAHERPFDDEWQTWHPTPDLKLGVIPQGWPYLPLEPPYRPWSGPLT